jgi:hypothetical protein
LDVPVKAVPLDASAPTIRKRAKRGLLPTIMEKMLTDYPGLTAQEYIQRIVQYNSGVKANSVGNELRRGDGIRYERRDKGWFLIKKGIEAEASSEG